MLEAWQLGVVGYSAPFRECQDARRVQVMEIRDAIREDRSCSVCLLNYRKDGTPFWNAFFMTPVFDPEGAVEHYIGLQVRRCLLVAHMN